MTETKRKTLVVDESGAGDYRTLTEAVAACAATPDEPVRFYIRHGIYEERPFIELADYVIEGEYRNATVITASVGGRDPWPGEVKTGTFRSATLFLGGGRAVVRNLTVQNNAGDGAKAGQALAVYAAASRVSGFECCPATPQLSTNADSLRFARLVAEKFGAMGMELRGIDGVRYIYFDDNDNRYIRESNDTTVLSDPTFTVVQKCGCPAVLVEEGFITNAGDIALVATDAACEAAAQAYYECILTYFDLT